MNDQSHARSPLGGLAEIIAEYDQITDKADRGDPEWDFVMRAADYKVIRARISELEAHVEQLKANLREETAIVDRIWNQLERPSYGELKGRSIYDLVDELKQREKDAKARIVELEALMAAECHERRELFIESLTLVTELAEQTRLASKFNLDCQDAQSRAYKAEAEVTAAHEMLDRYKVLRVSGERSVADRIYYLITKEFEYVNRVRRNDG